MKIDKPQIQGTNSTTKTDNYPVTLADQGTTLIMNSSSDKTFTLPSVGASDVGAVYTFGKIGTGRVTIQTSDSDTIMDSSAGGSIYNASATEVYAMLTLELVSTTQWAAVGGFGTWTTT